MPDLEVIRGRAHDRGVDVLAPVLDLKLARHLGLHGKNVLAASAYLDKEKVGERALFCLDADTGSVKWQAPLRLNPWGGPSVQGDLVVVSGSTEAAIRMKLIDRPRRIRDSMAVTRRCDSAAPA